MVWFALLFKISENLLESKPFETSRKLRYFMRVANLHTAPKRHLIKFRTCLRKIDCYLEKYKFARRFEGLRPNFLKF